MMKTRMTKTRVLAILVVYSTVSLLLYMMYSIKQTPQLPQLYAPRRTPQPTCTAPRHHLVYIKVHKTGGTTLRWYILEPYGYNRNLSFAVEKEVNVHLGYPHHFLPIMALPPLVDHYDFFVHESRYNLATLQKIMPKDSSYIFSVRKPLERFLSAFYYIGAPEWYEKVLNIKGGDPIEILRSFFADPGRFLQVSYQKNHARNDRMLLMEHTLLFPSGQLFSLGLDDANSMVDIHSVVKQMVSEFETFVVMEYFDESMVLLKRTMCWKLEDVLYPKLANKKSYPFLKSALPQDLREKILEYNRADAIFYEHANETFWKKLRQEANFDEELVQYRRMNKEFSEFCSKNNGGLSKFGRKCLTQQLYPMIHDRQKTTLNKKHVPEMRGKIENFLSDPVSTTKTPLS